jgi:hypothetical protein
MLAGQVLAAVGPADGVVTVPRGTIHEWRRSQTAGFDEELIVKEWTDPKDGQKEVFFRNLNGLIFDAIRYGEGSWRMRTLDLELLNLFWRQDNWPLMLQPSWPGWIQGAATRAVLTGAVVLGKVLGCKGVYAQYTRKST